MSQITITPKKALAGAAALAVVGLGTALGVTLSSPSCNGDPSAQLAALPSGGTFDGAGACYTVPNGVTLSKPVTVENAVFDDPSNAPPAKGAIKPIVKVLDTHDVTLTNVQANGANTKGAYSPTLAKEAGFSVLSSSNVTLTNISSSDTYGDGLFLFANFPVAKTPDTNVTVNGMNVTNAGRNGVTPADITHSAISGLVVNSAALDDIDFESDLSGVGAGYLDFYGGSWSGTHVSETLTGPVTFTGSQTGRVFQTTRSTVPAAYPVTFSGGTLTIPVKAPGIWIKGPRTFVFTATRFQRASGKKGPSTQPNYVLTNGANLTLNQSPPSPPNGTVDGTSTLNINP